MYMLSGEGENQTDIDKEFVCIEVFYDLLMDNFFNYLRNLRQE